MSDKAKTWIEVAASRSSANRIRTYEPPPYARWIAPPEFDGREVLKGAAGSFLLVIAILNALLVTPSLGIALAVFGLVVILWVSRRRPNTTMLLESAPSDTEMIVRIRYRRTEGTSLAVEWSDVGAMVIETDHIFFVSRSTSFLIDSSDVLEIVERFEKPRRLLTRSRIHLIDRRTVIEIEPLVGTRALRDTFLQRLEAFVVSSATTTEPRSLPPAYSYRPSGK